MRLMMILMAGLLFAGVARAEDDAFCANPARSCGQAIPAQCLSTLGAGSVSASADCAGRLAAYRDCLASVPERCQAVIQEPSEPLTPQRAAARGDDWKRRFDGRVGRVIIDNPTLYGFEVTLWHPDNGQIFGTWKVDGQQEVFLLLDNDAFSIGNDWGIQFGDAPARSVGEATQWTGDAWRASPSRFFQ